MSREPTKLCMDKYLKQTGDNEWTVIRPIVYLFDGYIGLIPVGFKPTYAHTSPTVTGGMRVLCMTGFTHWLIILLVGGLGSFGVGLPIINSQNLYALSASADLSFCGRLFILQVSGCLESSFIGVPTKKVKT